MFRSFVARPIHRGAVRSLKSDTCLWRSCTLYGEGRLRKDPFLDGPIATRSLCLKAQRDSRMNGTPATRESSSANPAWGNDDIPKIVTVFKRLPSKILDRFVAEGRINLVTAPADMPFAELDQWLLGELDGAHAAIVWPVAGKFGPEHIAAANASGKWESGRLKAVTTYSVGTDAIDKEACRKAGIKVGYTPYVGDDSIAEYTIAMLLHYCRRLRFLEDTVASDAFPEAMHWVVQNPTLHCGFSPAGKTVCFYGFGRIAQKTAEKLLAFGVSRIVYTTSRPKPSTADSFPRLHSLRETFYPDTHITNEPDLLELAAQADILILLCPGNASTNATINAKVFSRMKSTAVLLNVSRGTVVVNDDLESALKTNQIAAALLDVIHGEPHIYTDHPLRAPELKERVLILPHSASTEVETRTLMADVAARNVLTALGFEDQLLGDKASLLEKRAWTHFSD